MRILATNIVDVWSAVQYSGRTDALSLHRIPLSEWGYSRDRHVRIIFDEFFQISWLPLSCINAQFLILLVLCREFFYESLTNFLPRIELNLLKRKLPWKKLSYFLIFKNMDNQFKPLKRAHLFGNLSTQPLLSTFDLLLLFREGMGSSLRI